MANKLPQIISILILLFSVFISGCGQSGPLYLPPQMPSANAYSCCSQSGSVNSPAKVVPTTNANLSGAAASQHSLNNMPTAQSNHSLTMNNETINPSPITSTT